MKLSVAAYRAITDTTTKRLTREWQRGSHAYGSINGGSPSHSLSVEDTADKQPEIKSAFDGQSDQINASGGSSSTGRKSSSVSPPYPQPLPPPSPTYKPSAETAVKATPTPKNKRQEVKKFMSNQRSRGTQRWMKLRTTVQLSGAVTSAVREKKPPLKREDSFLKRFSTRHTAEIVATNYDDDEDDEDMEMEEDMRSDVESQKESQQPQLQQMQLRRRQRRRQRRERRSVINPDENFYFWWLTVITCCVLYNYWTLIVRQAFPELQDSPSNRLWNVADCACDFVFLLDLGVQFRTGYLEQGLMVYDSRKLAKHYVHSKAFALDLLSLFPLDLLRLLFHRPSPLFRFPRFFKVYRSYHYYYMVESRTLYPNLWRVVNLVHILLLLAHWFGCFYYLLSEAEGFIGEWVYPPPQADFAHLTRKYLASLYWSTLTLTTIGDLPTPESNSQRRNPRPTDISSNITRSSPSNTTMSPFINRGSLRNLRRGFKSRVRQVNSNRGYLFTIASYLCGVFVFATIVGQVGNVITNRNANRLEFERLLDGAKLYMRHHKVPREMQRRVQRWYDYTWSRGRMHAGGDINTALGILPDKLKTELALHVNLNTLKKVTIFQECQPEFLHDLVLKMKAYIFTPGDVICRKGEVAREMFIIADGILEVISETGKVLTTMKAGDFFGEIGILNLDGLNRRTADVRSVGYSELFSLSREDVLSAMKDYPEAQEILQTMGKKRLMEARKAAAKSKTVTETAGKTANDKDSLEPHLKGDDENQDEDGNTTESESARQKAVLMVKRLKRDAKDLKNYLIRSSSKSFRSASNSSADEVRIEMETVNGGRALSKRRSTVANDVNIHQPEIKSSPLPPPLPSSSAIQIGDSVPSHKPPVSFLQRVLALKNIQDSVAPVQPSVTVAEPENKKEEVKEEKKSACISTGSVEAWGATVELIRPIPSETEVLLSPDHTETITNNGTDSNGHVIKSILKHFSHSESDVSELLSMERDDNVISATSGGDKRKLTKTVSFRDHYLKSPSEIQKRGYNKPEECIADLLLGIKQILQMRLDDIQDQFRSRLVALESAMKDKDEAVRHIEHKIRDLENDCQGRYEPQLSVSCTDLSNTCNSSPRPDQQMFGHDDDAALTHPGYVVHPRRSWPMLPSRQKLVRQRSFDDCSYPSDFWTELSTDSGDKSVNSVAVADTDTSDVTDKDTTIDNGELTDVDDVSQTIYDDEEEYDEDDDDEITVQLVDEPEVEGANWEIQMLAKEMMKKELVSKLSNVVEEVEDEEEEEEDDGTVNKRPQSHEQQQRWGVDNLANETYWRQRRSLPLAENEIIQHFVHNTLKRLEKLEKVFTRKPGLVRQRSLQEHSSSRLRQGLPRQASCGFGESSGNASGANNICLPCTHPPTKTSLVAAPFEALVPLPVLKTNENDVSKSHSSVIQSPPTDEEDLMLTSEISRDPESQPLIKPK